MKDRFLLVVGGVGIALVVLLALLGFFFPGGFKGQLTAQTNAAVPGQLERFGFTRLDEDFYEIDSLVVRVKGRETRLFEKFDGTMLRDRDTPLLGLGGHELEERGFHRTPFDLYTRADKDFFVLMKNGRASEVLRVVPGLDPTTEVEIMGVSQLTSEGKLIHRWVELEYPMKKTVTLRVSEGVFIDQVGR